MLSHLTAFLLFVPLPGQVDPTLDRLRPVNLAPIEIEKATLTLEMDAGRFQPGTEYRAELELTDGNRALINLAPGAGGLVGDVNLNGLRRISTIQRIRLNFVRSTRSISSWPVRTVTLVGFNGARRYTLGRFEGFGVDLPTGGSWWSPVLPAAEDNRALRPSLYELEILTGADGRRRGGRTIAEMETTDGRIFTGAQDPSGNVRFSDSVRGGVRVGDIRAIRVGYTGGALNQGLFERTLDAGDDFDLRGVRLVARAPGGTIPVAEFPAINHRFSRHGWKEFPTFRPAAPLPTGDFIHSVEVKVLTGRDDLRRRALPAPTTSTDSSFEISLIGDGFYRFMPLELFAITDVRETVPTGTVVNPFPQGWEGEGSAGGVLRRNVLVVPRYDAASLRRVRLDFKPGAGDGLLLGGDTWSFRGLSVTIRTRSGVTRRLFTDYGVERNLSRETSLTFDLPAR